MKVLEPYLFVQREDECAFPNINHYDYKEGFKTLKEAKEYCSKCSFRWMSHRDVVYAVIYISYDDYMQPYSKTINLSRMSTDEQKAFCAEYGILYE